MLSSNGSAAKPNLDYTKTTQPMRTYFLQEYFYYTRLERNAGIVLCVLCGISFCIPFSYPLVSPPAGRSDFSEAHRIAVAFSPAPSPYDAEAQPVAFRGYENRSPKRQLETFDFDPNTASKDDLMRLGLSARTAQTVMNFRAKGGKFYKKEDLKKVYGLRIEDYERLLPYVQIAQQNSGKEYKEYSKYAENQQVTRSGDYEKPNYETNKFPKKNTAIIVDINAATVEDWQQIPGVGPGWAKRIVNFREKLGGFVSANQVGETFGLPDSVFQKMLPQMQPSTPIFRRINLNSATLDELKKHPYLSSFQATILFNYRTQHGNFTDLPSVKKVKAGFKDEDWQRLEPYFSYE